MFFDFFWWVHAPRFSHQPRQQGRRASHVLDDEMARDASTTLLMVYGVNFRDTDELEHCDQHALTLRAPNRPHCRALPVKRVRLEGTPGHLKPKKA